jgi:predicted DCC family thiol-disulfide oxidoreductase YuxK
VGIVLYDDDCGICRRWIPFWSGTLRKRGFDIAPLQSDVLQVPVSPEERLTDLRLLLHNGTLISGADVYRHIMRRIWWAYPLYVVSVAPLFRQAFNLAYRAFARHRHRISRACHLSGPRTNTR